MKRFLLTLFFLPLISLAQVESPPSLALGVAGVVGEKGSIDIDVLAQLISEKQGELKKEFIKKTIFQDLDNHSYVVWEYMYNSLNVLLESESKEAIKKNLLKNTTNLALVYGFSELYLQLSSNLCNSDLESLLAVYDTKYKAGQFSCPQEEKNIGLHRNITLANLKQYKKDGVSFSAFFLDLVFEVLRTNKTVNDLGFLAEPLQPNTSHYESSSAFYKIKKMLPVETASLKNRMTQEVELLLNNYILLRKWSKANVTLDTLVKNMQTKMMSLQRGNGINSTSVNYPQLFNALVDQTSGIYDELKSKNSPLGNSVSSPGGNTAIVFPDGANKVKDVSNDIDKNIAAFKRFVGKGPSFDQNDLFYIEKSIRPLLVRLVGENGFNPNYLQVAEDIDLLISTKMSSVLKTTLDTFAEKTQNSISLSKVDISKFSELLDFITRLDELDKVETYQFILKTLRDASEIFEDRKLGVYLKTVIENIDTYTILNTKENKVEIAVEDIITRLYEKYANRQSSIFGLYFSVGINQSISSNFTYQSLLPNSSGFRVDSLKSVAFVSEKIGLKVKLIDYKWRRSFTVGETYKTRVSGVEKTVQEFKSNKPLVSDIYFLAYGSGLLYKVANLTSDEEFSDPIMGLGVGIAFFNSLDLNIGYNWPLQSNNSFFENIDKKNLWTVSFDVKITEYLSALGKKRKSSK
jgi:hypothetical protein